MDELERAIQLAEDPYKRNRGYLLAIYDKVMKDPHLYSQIQATKHKILAEPFNLIDKDSGEENEELTELIERPWFYQYLSNALEAEFWGHSLMEFQEMAESDHPRMDMEFRHVKLVPRMHVKPEFGQIVIRPYDQEGIPFREEPFNEWLMEYGDAYDKGLLEIAAKHVIWKNYALSDWSRHAEKYGDPFMVIRSSGNKQEDLDKKEEMAAKFAQNSYAILDDDDQINLLESSHSDSYKIFMEMAKFQDDQDSKLINGQTMSADEGSSRSQAEVHERLMNNFVKSRMRSFQFHVNFELLPFLKYHGYPLDGTQFMFHNLIEDPEDEEDEMPTNTPQPRQSGRPRNALKKK